jgi:hypothetical protein
MELKSENACNQRFTMFRFRNKIIESHFKRYIKRVRNLIPHRKNKDKLNVFTNMVLSRGRTQVTMEHRTDKTAPWLTS